MVSTLFKLEMSRYIAIDWHCKNVKILVLKILCRLHNGDQLSRLSHHVLGTPAIDSDLQGGTTILEFGPGVCSLVQ